VASWIYACRRRPSPGARFSWPASRSRLHRAGRGPSSSW
jgi:hypothetical protein